MPRWVTSMELRNSTPLQRAVTGKATPARSARRSWCAPLRVSGTSAGARRHDAMAELPREVVAESAGAHARDRQAAVAITSERASNDPCAVFTRNPPAAGWTRSTAQPVSIRTGGPRAFVEQHAHDLLRRVVAKQLPELLLVVGDAMGFDHREKIRRREARQCGFAEMGVAPRGSSAASCRDW